MQFCSLNIENFKSIENVEITEADNAMILVGKNNTGKTIILDAILLLVGKYELKKSDFNDINEDIVIKGKIRFFEEDLLNLNEKGVISKLKNYELWKKEFKSKLPSFEDNILTFEFSVSKNGKSYYSDGVKKNNNYIKQLMPKIYFIDNKRNTTEIEQEILGIQAKDTISDLKNNVCIFDKRVVCTHCFTCIDLIEKKNITELTVYETAKLLEYKLFQINLNGFTEKFNQNFKKNGGGLKEIEYRMDFDVDKFFSIKTIVHHRDRNAEGTLDTLSAGFKSIYILSLLETYIQEKDSNIGSIIMIEDPEMFLHPQLQKVASEILYRLSKKNQVIFSTHSPNMIFNFSQRQIKQVVLDKNYKTVINENEDIDNILDDLGYNANDMMNVSFVFIVEGKQDSNRLPMLLEKYYSEIYDENDKLQRIAIIPTNSCTNIKTYANLKYINKLYLKDQFLMIRDSDGKNRDVLKKQLCNYYKEREKNADIGNLPRVLPKNVLILKYYSFENYFLDPTVMKKIGVIRSEEDFYNILYTKYKEHLFKLSSTRKMLKTTGIRINSKQDLKKNIEIIKIYIRGHNLFDIFYSKYRGSREEEILKKYIEVAPRSVFADILDAIDKFVYFENRKKED